MKILVCGSRKYNDIKKVYETLDKLDATYQITAVVHGAASGADTLAGRWAEQRGKIIFAVPADWERYGKSAGPKRNIKMLTDHPDIGMIVAFPGGAGTRDMINQGTKKNILILEV